MDRPRSKQVLARQIRIAYAGLFELNTQAQSLTPDELKGKFASLTDQSENVVKLMVGTFVALSKEAEFSLLDQNSGVPVSAALGDAADVPVDSPALIAGRGNDLKNVSFSHTLNINLPSTKDVAVYDAIFKALKEHLL